MEQERVEHVMGPSAGGYSEDILQGMPEAVIIVDAAGRIRMANNTAMSLLGYSGDELLGRHAETICPEACSGILTAAACGEAGQKQIAKYRETFFITRDNRRIPVEYACSSLSRNGDAHVICVASDATARKKAERRRSAQYAVVHALSEFRGLNDTLSEILKVVCESIDWILGEIWQVDPDNAALSLGILWNSPLFNASEFEAFSRQFSFEKGKGLPGRVWESGKPEWIADVSQDPDFCRHDAALAIGLHGTFAFPIRLLDEATGVMVFFSDTPQEPDGNLLEMFDALGLQIGGYIERKKMEEQIRKSLKEKEILIREVHHRVKSNLQVIISMIRVQAAHMKNAVLSETFREIENRIRAVALVHEKLYHEKDLSNINFGDYIKSVVRELAFAYGAGPRHIEIITEAESCYLAIDKAIPCGLIINELITNSLKHAFPDNRKGEIRIILRRKADGNELTVKDNGIGMSGDFELREAKTLGLQIVDTLVRQINGSFELKSGEGTEFHIWF